MTDPRSPVRVAIVARDDHLREQLARIVEVAGAVLVAASEADLCLVEDELAGSSGSSGPLGSSGAPGLPGPPGGPGTAGPPPGVPVVRVCLRRRRRGPVAEVVPGSEQVLELPADGEALLRHLASLGLVARARVVAVTGARGGAGASTIACALARACVVGGARTALVDLDADGGGLDLALAAEHEAGPRWADLSGERAGFPPAALSMALPRWEGVGLLSCDGRGGPAPGEPEAGDAVRALASEHDVVVLDVPRNVPWLGRAGAAGDGPALPRPDVLLVVAACDVRSAAAAARVARSAGTQDARLVVRVPGPGGLDPVLLAQACGLPLAATTRTERGSAAAAERGEAPGDHKRGAVARTARTLVDSLGLRP